MLLCAHRLSLFRLRAGLPSYLPQQRLRTELLFQQRGPIRARHLSESALRPNVAISSDTVDAIRASAAPHDLGLEGSTSAIPATTSDDGAGIHTEILDEELDSDIPNIAADRKPGATLIRSPHGPDRAVTHEQIGTIVYHYYSPNGKMHTSVRHVSKELWRMDMAVRKKSLYDGLGPIRRWRVAFDAITEAKSHEDNAQNHPIQLSLSKGDEALLEKLKVDPEQSFSTAWAALKKAKKIGHWERLSLWLLYHYPELVPTFLRITCAKPIKPVFSCVSACILYLQRFFPSLVDKSLITTCLHPSVWPVLLLPQKGVRVFLRKADRSGVYYAWHLTQKKRLHMTPQSILCFMNRFTEFRDIDRALEAVQIVRNMKHPILDLRSESVIRHCCKLLTLDSVVSDGNNRNFHILPKLLELGVKPTRDLMNVVLSNAYKTGDPRVGQSILDYMKQQKMEPDSFTYLALLTESVRMGDRERLESLLQEIKPKKELHRNPWISSKILHSHFVFTAKQINPDEDPYAVFYSMLDMYNRLHDITPLKELSIIPHHYTPPEGSANTPPSIVALYIMIATYLRCMRSFNLTEHVCARFKALVMEGHELIAPLAATDHVYNEFLAAFRKDPRGLRSSVQLIDHMLHNTSSDASSKDIANSVFKHAAPTVRTWTLLMSAFVFNKQPLAAEKVRAMMNKHGVEYQLWTWNIIINSYANSQNVPALAQAIKDMERKGVAPDKYTLNSLRYLQDPERLWVAIDELDRISNRSSAAVPTDEENVEKEKDGGSLLEQGLRRLKDTMAAKS